VLIGVLAVALLASGCDSGSARHPAASTSTVTAAGTQATTGTVVLRPVVAAKSDCAFSLVNDAFTGAHATASAIGWAGNQYGVVTCLGGRFYVQGDIGQAFGFGIYAGGPTDWVDADGYLPAQITSFTRRGVRVVITEFADRVELGGHAYVAVYCRVAVTNPTNGVVVANPGASPGLTALAIAPNRVGPRTSVVHDYVLAVDRFGNSYPWPSPRALAAAGSFRSALRAHARLLACAVEQDRAGERSRSRAERRLPQWLRLHDDRAPRDSLEHRCQQLPV
jgi:hypothetical protein